MNTPTPTVTVPGAELAYDIEGSGPPLVQLHGLTSSRRRDEALELNLAEDVPGQQRIRYDARGHGLSSGRDVVEDYTWPVLARDLTMVLDELAAGESVDAIGQSMGAATLLHAALADDSRFRTLTLVIPPTAWASRTAQREAYLAGADLAQREGLAEFSRLATSMPRPPAAPPAPQMGPDVVPDLLPTILRGAASSDLPSLDALRAVATPTLILAWIDDPSHPLATSEALAHCLPNAELVVASTPEESLTWGARTAAHIAAHSTAP